MNDPHFDRVWAVNPLCLALFLVGLPLVAGAQEKAVPGSSRPAPPPGTETEDKNFRDPFAAEGEKSASGVKVSDPLEPMNRAFFRFNDKLYFWALKPAAKAYNKVAPQPVRSAIERFFANVRYPIRLANNLLEAKLQRAGIETARFVVNSTVGLAGFLDPAHDQLKLDAQPADFDQTLGFYGIPSGMYLDWPLLGPSSVRGTVGLAGDALATPWLYFDGVGATLAVRPYETINSTSLRLGEYEAFKKAALDPYVAMRSFYYENRRGLIHRRSSGRGEGPASISEEQAMEELARARRLREDRAILHRLQFSMDGLSSGMKGAERLMLNGLFTAPSRGTNFNLNVDFLHEGGAAVPSSTNRLDLPRK